MNDPKTKKGPQVPLRKNLAQDRLNRLREDLKFKRKMEEKLEKFNTHQFVTNSSSTMNVFVDKFLPNGNQVQLHTNRKSEDHQRLSRGKVHEPKFNSKRTINWKCPEQYSHKVKCPRAEPAQKSSLSKETYPSNKGKNTDTIHSTTFDNSIKIHSNASGNPNYEIQLPSRGKPRKRKRGIAAERLERVKSALATSSGKICYELTAGKKKTSLRECTSPKTSSTANKSSIKTPKRNSVNPTDANSNSVGTSSGESILETPALTESKLESNNDVFGNCDNAYCDSESMDVDDPSSSTSVNLNVTNSPVREPTSNVRWKEEEDNISFFVNEVDLMRKDSAYLVRHEDYMPDVEMNLSVPSGDLLIIVDTNIFLSHLRFLHRLLNSSLGTYRSHVLVVPWLVIQEIDYAMKKQNRKLAAQAKLANYFIFECLKKQDTKFFGQSFEDFKINFKNAVSIDDFLLQYCLKLITLRNNVVLLTDDKNLCNKCMFSHVPVYTKNEFEKTFDVRDNSK